MKKDEKVIDYYEKYRAYVKKQRNGLELSDRECKQMTKLRQWISNDKERTTPR